MDIAARHPFTASCFVSGSNGAFVSCQPTPALPTTGFETVIQNVNISLNQDTGSVQPVVTELADSTAGGFFQFLVPMFTQSQGGTGQWIGDQPSVIYLCSDVVNPLQYSTLFNSGSATVTCTVSEYTVSLP